MFDGATLMIANYSAPATPTAAFFNQVAPAPAPVPDPVPDEPAHCFLKGTKIETSEGMICVEDLKAGMRIKTYKHGLVPLTYLGKQPISHLNNPDRIPDQLYVCRKEIYPGATDDLVLTGHHSLLVDREFENAAEKQRVLDVMSEIYLTDNLYRVPAAADLNADVYNVIGTYEVYHFSLKHEDPCMNYGIYANGILAETCSETFILDFSNLTIVS